jgi:hypothetical protein
VAGRQPPALLAGVVEVLSQLISRERQVRGMKAHCHEPTRQGPFGGLASWRQTSKSSSRRFPVTVTQLPLTRCQICHRTVAYRPGSLSQALTEHYRRTHPEALGLPAR